MSIKVKNPVAQFLILAGVLLTVFIWALSAFGVDIQKGFSFGPTEHVTAAKLNGLVDDATINTDFVHLKTGVAPVSADEVLIYQPSSALYRKVTMANLLIGNTNLIMGNTEDTSPATNDMALTYDTSAGTFKRVALLNWLQLGTFVELTNAPDQQYMLYITSNGVPYRTSMTNLFQTWWRWEQFANPTNAAGTDPSNFLFSAHTKPTNSDAIRIWDSHANTNKYTTLAGLITNSFSATVLTNTDSLWGFATATNLPSGPNQFGTNPIVSQITLGSLSNWLAGTTIRPYMPTQYAIASIPLGANTGGLLSQTHGLPGTPTIVRCVLVMTNASADGGWGQNHEVDIGAFFDNATGKPWYAIDANFSSVFLTAASSGTWAVRNGSTGAADTTITASKWNAKVYLVYYPSHTSP